MMFGSHLSISGGMQNAVIQAKEYGFDTVQVFTKNQQQWRFAPLTEEAIKLWKAECARVKFTQTVSHDSYLINMASPDEKLWRASIGLFTEELRRCVQLGIPWLVTHPGAHMGSGEEVGLARIAAALDMVHKAIAEKTAITCLEITAGQGSSLGYRLEHLAKIIELVDAPNRLAVCLDTAHLFAAGYDFRGRLYDDFMKQVQSTIGVDRIKVLHLNDSKKELGSRVDRHDHIGHGTIGLEGFRPWVRDKRFVNVPKILETPKAEHESGRPWDVVNLETLRGLMA
ncbi:MAG: deoxyribonuclease IV [Phycisphaerales bacterium]|jgi:deoxyribonuclease-4|nr:deoxyribonuclease IV [Phycisphaerales bacterium]